MKVAAIQTLKRLCRQYAAALRAESARYGILRSARGLVVSRLAYGVGPRYYSLFEFAQVPTSQWSNYVTDDPAFKEYLLGMTPLDVGELVKDKARFYDHCKASGIPTIPILAVVTSVDRPPPRSAPQVNNVDAWRQVLSLAPDDLFVKSVDGSFGEGAFRLKRRRDRWELASRLVDADDVYRHLAATLGKSAGWLVQPTMRCHPSLCQIMSSSGLGTLRVVTGMDDEGARVVFALIKLTVGENVTDNFHHGQTGNLLSAIDVTTGRLSAARGSRSVDWPVMQSFRAHPDTGRTIEGFMVPHWDEVVELAKRAQRSLPQLRSAGWDIALTSDGPIVVEANNTYSIDILQVAYQRGLRDELAAWLGPGMRDGPTRQVA